MIDHPFWLCSKAISVVDLAPLAVQKKYDLPASCGTVTVTSFAPATTLVPFLAAGDGKILDSPTATETAFDGVSIPFTTCVISTGFLGAKKRLVASLAPGNCVLLFNPSSNGSLQVPSSPTTAVFSEITAPVSGFLTVTLTVALGIPVPVNSESDDGTESGILPDALIVVFIVGAVPLLIILDLAIESVDPSL